VGGGPGQIVRRSAGEGFGSVRVSRGGEMVVLQSYDARYATSMNLILCSWLLDPIFSLS
jgi:hypothetical protein